MCSVEYKGNVQLEITQEVAWMCWTTTQSPSKQLILVIS